MLVRVCVKKKKGAQVSTFSRVCPNCNLCCVLFFQRGGEMIFDKCIYRRFISRDLLSISTALLSNWHHFRFTCSTGLLLNIKTYLLYVAFFQKVCGDEWISIVYLYVRDNNHYQHDVLELFMHPVRNKKNAT